MAGCQSSGGDWPGNGYPVRRREPFLTSPLVARPLWHWIGEQIRIPTLGSNDGHTLFGALNIRTGRWRYLIRLTMRKENFIADARVSVGLSSYEWGMLNHATLRQAR